MSTCKILSCYDNGNYSVKIYEDGTKVRFTMDDEFESLFPESIDIKITNYCDNFCVMCHEESSVFGKHGNFDYKFFDTLERGTELAIGGGNPLSHPMLISFLNKMKNRGIICNLTVNQKHFFDNKKLLKELIDSKLIYGLGISLLNDIYIEDIIDFVNCNNNCVIHLIAGMIDFDILKRLYDKDIKILILGYKEFGRGEKYLNDDIRKNIDILKDGIIDISKHFYVVSFDNLAISQLDMRNKMSAEDFERYYMGDDGLFTMYIDLVKEEFAKSSISVNRYKLLDDIKDMFRIVKKEK